MRHQLQRTIEQVQAVVIRRGTNWQVGATGRGQVDKVGVQDNFFELGGHSLLATQIASRVQKALQRDVPLRAMFECSTVEELAAYIDGLAANEISAGTVDRLSDLMAELEGL